MSDFLFMFSYESPVEWKTNQEQGTDFESSSAVWVVASDPESALQAGRTYADGWVNEMFLKEGIESYPGWASSNFAHWIEQEPLKSSLGWPWRCLIASKRKTCIEHGELPLRMACPIGEHFESQD